MALWFAEAARPTICDQWDHVTHLESDMLSEMDREEQVTVDLDAWAARHQTGGGYMMIDDWLKQQESSGPSGAWNGGSFW